MKSKPLLLGVIAITIAAVGGVMVLFVGSSAAAACSTAPAVGSSSAPVDGYSQSQMDNATAIAATGRTMGVPERGIVIAIMTALGESSLQALPHGDTAGPDSRGLFQQRDGWGTLAERMDPAQSSALFYTALLKVPGWQDLDPSEAAHRVQRNADPQHYTKYWTAAMSIYAAVSGADPATVPAAVSSGCLSGDTLAGGYGSSGTACDFGASYTNPHTCREALASASNIASTQACSAPPSLGSTWRRWCLAFVAIAYGRSAAGYGTAMEMYHAMQAKGLVSTSKDNIPPGALVFFTASSSAGHVALYAGGGAAWSNDYLRSGCIDLTPMSTLGAGGRYLGWAPPAFPS
jgi:hypothetical protein